MLELLEIVGELLGLGIQAAVYMICLILVIAFYILLTSPLWIWFLL